MAHKPLSMNRSLLLILLAASCLGIVQSSWAQDKAFDTKPIKPAATVALPPGVTEEMLAPPPMPAFMLKKPVKPLSMDEMVQQAREAEQRAGVKSPTANTPAPKASSPSKAP